MIVLVAMLGLALGTALNQLIARQLRDPEQASRAAVGLRGWLPVVGPIVERNWLALGVDVLTMVMAVVLWHYYGWQPRFWLLLAATLVLIDTAAIDWQVRLIDTLVMIGATVLAVALAPWIISSQSIGSWQNSLLGMLTAGFIFLLFFVFAKMLYPQQHAPFGLGDVYLGMFIGALLGLFRVGPALFYGMMLAGVASMAIILFLGYQRARHIPIAYGSFLCLGVLLYLALEPFS